MELRERIEQILETSWIVDETQIHDNYDLDIEKATNRILTVLKETGYRKIPSYGSLDLWLTTHMWGEGKIDARVLRQWLMEGECLIEK